MVERCPACPRRARQPPLFPSNQSPAALRIASLLLPGCAMKSTIRVSGHYGAALAPTEMNSRWVITLSGCASAFTASRGERESVRLPGPLRATPAGGLFGSIQATQSLRLSGGPICDQRGAEENGSSARSLLNDFDGVPPPFPQMPLDLMQDKGPILRCRVVDEHLAFGHDHGFRRFRTGGPRVGAPRTS